MALCAVDQAAAQDIVVHAGRLLDGTTAPAQERVSIIIHENRIVAVERGFTMPEGRLLIDLSHATVLPGLIDAHVHLLMTPGGNPLVKALTRSSFDRAFDAVPNARATLLAGFTSVRDLGNLDGSSQAAFALRSAIADGRIEGPRIWAAGVALGPTGGHSDLRNGLDPDIDELRWSAPVIDGVDEAVKAVRRLKREGADVIKIMPSGGVISNNDDPTHQLMSNVEIAAVVQTAHALGLKVAAHGHAASAIAAATRSGVDSIEHGSFATAEIHQQMKASGAYLVPTLLVAEVGQKMAREHPELLNPSSVRKALQGGPMVMHNLATAYHVGVKIAFGSDAGIPPHGSNAQEFKLLVQAGMSPADAILAATRNAADLLGASADIGSVTAGKYADLVAVSGDPRHDISILENIFFVMKDGNVVKNDSHTSGSNTLHREK